MRKIGSILCLTLATGLLSTGSATASPIYLNSANITVVLGPGMAAEPFANRTTAESLANVIDAPTAGSGEFHNQTSHVWVNGGFLVLDFDLGVEYDLSQLHFWNYHSEAYDVDNVSFQFFNASNVSAGALAFEPILGNGTGSDSTPIFAESYTLAFPGNVRFVRATLTGSNQQVDFNNIGFTAELSDPSPVPEHPATFGLLALGLAAVASCNFKR